MKVQRGYAYRLYPTKEQEQLLVQFVGSYRFAWNWALARWKSDLEAGLEPDMYAIKKAFNALKKTEQFVWLKKMPRLNDNSVLNLGQTWIRHKKSPKKFGAPGFKRKQTAESCLVDSKVLVKQKNGRIFLGGSKLEIKAVIHRPLPGIIKASTLKRNSAGQWFIVYRVEFDEHRSTLGKESQPSLGFDLGLNDLIAMSDGVKIEAPKYYRESQEKRTKLQRVHAKKLKGSKNREKSRIKLAKHEMHISNQRRDLANKISHKLARENQAITGEDLNVKGMGRGLNGLRKSVHDAGFGMIVGMLKYKCERESTIFKQIQRFERSTGVCPNTLERRAVKLTLAERKWTCSCCGSEWDRDIAAAQVIEQLGRDAAKVKSMETVTSTLSMKSVAQARSLKQKTVRAGAESFTALA